MNKLQFILPRIFGLAIIAGIGAILLSALFKLLLLAGIAGTIVHLGMKRFRRRQLMQQHYGLYGQPAHARMSAGPEAYYGQSPFYRHDVTPAAAAQRSAGIIPIN